MTCFVLQNGGKKMLQIYNYITNIICKASHLSAALTNTEKYHILPIENILCFYKVKCVFIYILWNNQQQMQLYAVNFIPLLGSLYMFRVFYTPIIRSTIF